MTSHHFVLLNPVGLYGTSTTRRDDPPTAYLSPLFSSRAVVLHRTHSRHQGICVAAFITSIMFAARRIAQLGKQQLYIESYRCGSSKGVGQAAEKGAMGVPIKCCFSAAEFGWIAHNPLKKPMHRKDSCVGFRQLDGVVVLILIYIYS